MTHHRWRAALVGATGILFAVAAAVRSLADETSAEVAGAWASGAWLVSHSLAMAAFVLLLPTVLAVRDAGIIDPVRPGAIALTWLGTALVLPYYGAETFGLAAAGRYAVTTGDRAVVEAIEAFRWAPVPMVTFGAGLLALAVLGVLVVRSTVLGTGLVRLGGTLTGFALLTYLPQFFLPLGARAVHGAVLGTGLVLLALWLARSEASGTRPGRLRQEGAPSSA